MIRTMNKNKPSPRYSWRSIGVLLVAIGLFGCSKENGSTPINGRAPQIAGAGSVQTPGGQTVSINGWIITEASYQDSFQDAVTGFAEADLAPEYLGYVSARASGGTGVYVGGLVPLQSGLLNTSNTPRTDIRTDSYFLIAIYDEYANRPDASGKIVGPYAREFTSASGYVQGNRAYLKFTSTLGSVELEGTFDQNTFEGSITYDNVKRWDGQGEGSAGTLGYFQVPTCQFFKCR